MWEFRLFGYEFYQVFYIFFIYCLIGWIYESLLVSVKTKTIVNRGFLHGPVIPVYGLGALFIYFVFWGYRDNLLMVFIGGSFLATLLEYFTSVLMEGLFHARWWDYSSHRFNLKGRVCLLVSVIWGFLALLLVLIFQPGIDYILNIIPRFSGEIAGYVIITLFLADITVTVIDTVSFDRLLQKLSELREELMEFAVVSKLYETKEEMKEKLTGLRLSGMLVELKSTAMGKLSHKSGLAKQEPKKIGTDMEAGIKEFTRRYQILAGKKLHIHILKAFPTMKVGLREAALHELKDKITMKGAKELGKDIKEEMTGRIKGYLSGFLWAAIVGLLVLLQFILIFYFTYVLKDFSVYLYYLLQVMSIVIIIGLVNDNRNVSYKISWICIIAILPITGFLMFILWGNRRGKKLHRRILQKLTRGNQFLEYNAEVIREFAKKYPTKSRMTRYLERNNFPLYKNNKIDYYPMAEETFGAIFEEMEKAERFILINFYIVGEGALWDRMHELLLKKIAQKVKVMFLYDDFGAMLRTPRNFRKSLENEGFEIRVFNPIHKYTDKLYMNYRSHQKIIVVDGNVGFTGGMNLADEYVNLVPRFGVWKDNGIKVTGDAVWGLTVAFLQMWEASGTGQIDYESFRPTKVFEENDVFCQVISDGPANNPKNPIENIYKQMIYYAKKVLYITTPYLIIEDDMREALITAAISGVDVRIITPFIPDKKNVKLLTNYNYGRLLEAGVRIFEYKPGFIHAKTIISEDSGIVGTINMDYRSFHLQYECGVWICNREVIDRIREDLLKTMEESREVTYEEWMNRPVYIKLYQMVLNLFSTLM